MQIRYGRHLAKPPFNLREKLRSDFVTRVAFDSPKAALRIIMLKKGLACILELLKSCLPCVDRIVFPLSERLPGHVVREWYFRGMEGGVVHSS